MSAKTVMIVDDSKYIIGLLERFFTDTLNFKVVCTTLDATNAFELYKRSKPDLLTLDLSMPNKDGKEILKEVIAEDPEANVLIISAVRGDAMLDCMTMGARGYIEKPLRLNNTDFVEDFIETVNEVLEVSEE